jgi:GcrA cell cycle regulator
MWTEEAIETLRQLALAGISASRIAVALGAPSRNAVIGKAHRIGIRLNGRGNCSAPSGGGAERARAERPRLAAVPRRVAVSCKQSLASARSPQRETKAPWIFAEAEVGEMRRVGFAEIRALDCRWPLGDPTCEDFAYCGLDAAKGRSYCAGHCRMAYRSPYARAREGRRDERWPREPASPWRLPEPALSQGAT